MVILLLTVWITVLILHLFLLVSTPPANIQKSLIVSALASVVPLLTLCVVVLGVLPGSEPLDLGSWEWLPLGNLVSLLASFPALASALRLDKRSTHKFWAILCWFSGFTSAAFATFISYIFTLIRD